MKLRTQLIVSMAFFTIALLLIAASVINSNVQIDRLSKQEDLVKNIELKTNELNDFSNNYILYHESLQLDNWNDKYASISSDISNLTVEQRDQQALLISLKADQQRLKDTFNDIVARSGSPSGTPNSTLDPAFIQVSLSRIGVQSQGVVFDASQLAQKIDEEEDQQKMINYLLIIALLGVFGAFLLTSYFLVYRRTLKSIADLQAGTEIVGSGDFDHVIEENKGDEFGELAGAFNRMSMQLKIVTASKSDLEKEVTERKRAEVEKESLLKTVQEEKDRLSTLVNSISDEVWFADINKMVTLVNPAVLQEFGPASSGDSVEKIAASYEVYRRDGSPRPVEEAPPLRALNDELVRNEEEIVRTPASGELRYRQVSASPVKDAVGHIIGSVSVVRDVTERKRAEEALRESEEKYRTIVETAGEGIVIARPDGPYFYVNQRMADMLGYSVDEILGKSSWDFTFDDYRPQVLQVRKDLQKGEVLQGEFMFRRKDGSAMWTMYNASPIFNDKGEHVANMAMHTNNTERKRAEEELLAAKQQAELYLDLMGHDISNMHQIMMMQMEIAQEILNTNGKLECEDREIIDSSARTLRKAARLIDNVRKLQKLRSGEYKLETVDLAATLKDVLKDYSSIPGRDITIKYSPDGKRLVLANPLLKDVFSNLLDNAVKHSSGPLEIVVEVNKVRLKGSSYYRVAIEDNGNGIPDDMKEEVFHRFRRGQTNAKGTGLGLYLVKSLVDGFGGQVEVQNRVLGDHTKGTRFLVYLPAIEEEKNARE